MRKRTKQILSFLLCIVLVLGMVPTTVFATGSDGTQTTLDVSKGNIVIGDGTLDAYGDDGTQLTTADPDGYYITGTTTSKTVRIIGGSHVVYVRELDINAAYAAFYIENAHVDLLLLGNCTLDSGNGYYDLHLEGTNASVTINGNGSLYAGYIGGTNGGTITIENGGFNFDDVSTGGKGTITIKGGIYKYGYPSDNCVGMQKVPVAERYKVIEDPTRNWRYEVVHGGYNISFHAGDGGNGEMDSLTGVSGSYTLPKCTFTAPAGKVFAGWSTTENGTVITERSIAMNQDYIFYAQWVDISDAGVAIDEANFPDAAFRDYVAASFDINQNGYLSDADISAATEIDVMGKSITSLTGVEHFTALTKLKCDTNQLTSLDISKNTSLLELDCGANDLTSLDVSNNTLLTSLTCDANKLTSLDVGNNTQLSELECSYNKLTSLDVSKNTVLTYLGCNANELTTLNVSNNTGLEQLECSNNQLTSLDLSMNSQLSMLFCSGNAYLISVGADRTFDLTNLPGNIDVTKASNWTGGTVEGTLLTVEPDTASVTYTYANVSNDSVIFTLNVLDTSIQGILVNESNFPDAVFREYISTKFDTNNDSSLGKEEIDAVTEISVAGKAIASLQGVEYFTALIKLVCDNCQLTSLDVSKNIALQKLSCVGNQIISLDVSSNINLAQLVCSNNQLTSLNVKDDVLLICQGNSYAITVDSANRTFDLTNLPGDFDATKASNWSGGTVEENILTVNSGTSQITYIYACGGTYIGQDNGVFTLNVTEGSTYTVTLKANGGTEDDIVKTDIVGNYNLPACTFTAPAGKQFKGWATSASGTIITTENINVTANITLYAIWENIPATEYDVTVINGTATVGAGSPITKATEGTVITITAEAAPAGQQFKNWTVEAGGVTLEDANSENTKFTMGTADVTVRANYEDIPQHTHGNGTLHSGTPSDCATGTNGEKDYYICSCDDKFYDAACTQPVVDVNDLIIAWKHTLTHHDADPADCCNDGIIEYWDCSVCNKKFSDEGITEISSIVDPAAGAHTGTAWESDGEYHWHECTVGGTEFGKEAHEGGEANCQNGKICIVCSKEYSSKDADKHAGTEEWTQTATTHKKAYTCCGVVVVEEEAHEWNDGVCSECGYGCSHTGGTATCTDKAICEICGNAYGDLNAEKHSGTAEWTKTSTTHKKAYTCCGVVVIAEEAHEWNDGVCSECGYGCSHTGGTATCTDKAVCKICGNAYGNLNADKHSSDGFTYTANNDGTHKKAHNCCGAEVTASEACSYGSDDICDLCGYEKESPVIPVDTYEITVTGGKATTGAGTPITEAAEGTVITITADAAPAGQQFKNWTVEAGGVTLANANASTTTFTMGTANVTVKANYEDIPVTEYSITVTNGTATIGAGTEISKAEAGQIITITANAAPAGQEFDKWEIVSGAITLTNANSAETTFTMAAEDVSVKAVYRDKDSGHTHTFNKQIASSEHLATEANCEAPATYYKSCECGHNGTETFAYGEKDAANHISAEFIYQKNDDGTHKKLNKCCEAVAAVSETCTYGSDDICDLCGYEKVTPEEETKISIGDMTEDDIPEELKDMGFDSPEKILDELTRVITETGTTITSGNKVLHEVTLQISLDGGKTWIDATEDNFPIEGITVTLPYPAGTSKDDFNFVVAHMFSVTSARLGIVAGDVELPVVTKLDAGIQVTLNGLSPVLITWTEIDEPVDPDDTTEPDDTTKPDDSDPSIDDVPQTGDNSRPILWIGLMAASIIGIFGLTVFGKKKRQAK